jgi:hypothetical protein
MIPTTIAFIRNFEAQNYKYTDYGKTQRAGSAYFELVVDGAPTKWFYERQFDGRFFTIAENRDHFFNDECTARCMLFAFYLAANGELLPRLKQ